MPDIFSKILGFVVLVLVFLSMQTKKMKLALLCQIGIGVLGMISYALSEGFAGSGIYLIATAQSIIFFFIRSSGKNEPRWLTPVVCVAYVLCTFYTFENWIDLTPMVAAIISAVGISQKKATNYRIAMLLNGAVWVTYDAFLAPAMLPSHIVTIVAALWGIIRLDILKKRK
jgi:hypothetical protein